MQYLPHKGELSCYGNKYINHKDNRGLVKVSNPKLWRLGRETRVKQMRFQVFPEGCDRKNISYLEGERVPKDRGIIRWGCEIT